MKKLVFLILILVVLNAVHIVIGGNDSKIPISPVSTDAGFNDTLTLGHTVDDNTSLAYNLFNLQPEAQRKIINPPDSISNAVNLIQISNQK